MLCSTVGHFGIHLGGGSLDVDEPRRRSSDERMDRQEIFVKYCGLDKGDDEKLIVKSSLIISGKQKFTFDL